MSRARVKNAADPEQVGKASRTAVFDRDRELNDLRSVLDTVEGRRVLWRLMGLLGIFAPSFDTDALRMARHAALRDFALFLRGELGEASIKAWMLMQIEASDLEADDPDPSIPDA